ncbi:MAG: LacI family DNA-binding transcriptional regulator [Victivallales bacterium]|nr:LacI family DNA-binding transcriptional regulator [Victivallales bacterium]
MTIYDIAERLDVSAATVSLALNGSPKVAEKTRARVWAFASEHGFMRNEQARNFRLKRSSNVAIVVHNIDNDFWHGVVRAVENELGENYNVILCNTEGDAERERRVFVNLMSRKIDGVIVQPASGEEEHLVEMARAGIPVVSLEQTANPELSFVKGNDNLAAYHLAEECIRRGHRRIAFVNFHFDCVGLRERVAGFCRSIEEHGLQGECKVLEAKELSPEAVRDLMQGHEKDYSLYLCSDDRLACLLLKELLRGGISVPADVSVCGWNDSRFLTYFPVPLSSVAIPMTEIGAKAAAIIRESLEQRPVVRKIYVAEKILLRESFRAMPAGGSGGL